MKLCPLSGLGTWWPRGGGMTCGSMRGLPPTCLILEPTMLSQRGIWWVFVRWWTPLAEIHASWELTRWILILSESVSGHATKLNTKIPLCIFQTDLIVLNEIIGVMGVDALTSSHPLSSKEEDILTPAHINQLFDSITYSKVQYNTTSSPQCVVLLL